MKNLEFKYTPLAEQSFTLDTSKIKQIYSGQLNICRCGCGGDYHTPEDKSYESMLLSVMTYIESGHYEIKMDFWKDEDYIEFQTTTKDNCDDSGFYYETAEMGFAIYLNK